jgi:hypothetical protein
MWRARFGRGFGTAVRQTTKWMNEWLNVIAESESALSLSAPPLSLSLSLSLSFLELTIYDPFFSDAVTLHRATFWLLIIF